MNKAKKNIQELNDIIKILNIMTIGVPEGMGREVWLQDVLEEIIKESLSNIGKEQRSQKGNTYLKRLLMDQKEDLDSNTKLVRDLKTWLISMDRSIWQKFSKDATELTQLNKWAQLISVNLSPYRHWLYFFSISPWDLLQDTKHALASFKKSKSCHSSSETTTERNWRPISQNTPENMQRFES